MKTKSHIPSLLCAGAGFALALFAGCATSPTVRSHADPVVAYANYQSFALMRPAGWSARNPAATPALIRQMRENTQAAFAAKGLREESETAADLLIFVRGGLEDKLAVTDGGLPYGRFGRGFGGPGGRYEFDQCTARLTPQPKWRNGGRFDKRVRV